MNIVKREIYFYYWLLRTWPKRWDFPKYKIQTVAETIDDIVKNKKSISRFGDGEFRLISRERNICFQDLSIEISERLYEVITSNESNLIIGLPEPLVRNNKIKRASKIHWLNFINLYKKDLIKFLDSNRVYGNSYISRFYITYLDSKYSLTIVEKLKTIWEKQELLIVEGEFSRLGVGNDLFANAVSIKRIICPSENAYSRYKEILEAVKKHGKDKLILIALGPTASILSYDLAKLGFWALDVGHIDVEYMWMLQKAKSKVSLKGRYVSEAGNGKDFELLNEYRNEYFDSIIEKVIEN